MNDPSSHSAPSDSQPSPLKDLLEAKWWTPILALLLAIVIALQVIVLLRVSNAPNSADVDEISSSQTEAQECTISPSAGYIAEVAESARSAAEQARNAAQAARLEANEATNAARAAEREASECAKPYQLR